LYRLVSATGREASLQKTDPWKDHLQAVSDQGYTQTPQDTRSYTETYDYDDVGNLTKLTHAYGTGSDQWVRDYTTESGSNRISGMDVGGNSYTYSHDAAGNMAQENTARHFEWDQAGRMRAFRNQVTGSEATVFAHYNYDGGGQRVQKVVTRGAKTTRTVYVEGVFEHRQVLENDAITDENQTLHLMDDTRRVATHRVGPRVDGSNPAGEDTQYHLSDHLQSSVAVVLDNQVLRSREQYRPYGETAYGSFAYKRYRFTGKEKDEESGLHYHGARYYAPWLAKWTAADPKGMVDGPNAFVYVGNHPTMLADPSGENGEGSPFVDPQVKKLTLKTMEKIKVAGAPGGKTLLKEAEDVRIMGGQKGATNKYIPFRDTVQLNPRTRRRMEVGELVISSSSLAEELTHRITAKAYNQAGSIFGATLQRAEDYYASGKLLSGAPITDPERVVHEAAGEYAAAIVSSHMGAKQELETVISILEGKDSLTPSSARAFYRKIENIATEFRQARSSRVFGYQEGTFGETQRVSTPMPTDLVEAVNVYVLGGQPAANLEDNETLRPLLVQAIRLTTRKTDSRTTDIRVDGRDEGAGPGGRTR
jgi:RHS repeat-associated protein